MPGGGAESPLRSGSAWVKLKTYARLIIAFLSRSPGPEESGSYESVRHHLGRTNGPEQRQRTGAGKRSVDAYEVTDWGESEARIDTAGDKPVSGRAFCQVDLGATAGTETEATAGVSRACD
ncbi:uncharacterized protein PV09_07307 [Verruconis gallopava]|uniref:Uncharacterized protein n=1 Tax=Verruconis gallopava TaxID=253628 RepID=A0A0D2AQ22_9PEZI|nr:uncharacterized protein PV09_07307 [Verruconis gallopava]KIW01269.1 hypothetical protein PV09_07307 [Verruconis gallopava]